MSSRHAASSYKTSSSSSVHDNKRERSKTDSRALSSHKRHRSLSSSSSSSATYKKHKNKEKPGKKSKKTHKKKKNKRSSSSSSSDSSDAEELRLLQRLENERQKLRERKKKEKELMKANETPEEKRARRLREKQEKERKRRERMGWDNEYQCYTNQDNPFGDSALTQTFVWGKKLSKEGIQTVSREELEVLNRQKQMENKIELEKVKQRRLEREAERAAREAEATEAQRAREAAQFHSWARQEDAFHLQQARLRSQIRIRDGRGRPDASRVRGSSSKNPTHSKRLEDKKPLKEPESDVTSENGSSERSNSDSSDSSSDSDTSSNSNSHPDPENSDVDAMSVENGEPPDQHGEKDSEDLGRTECRVPSDEEPWQSLSESENESPDKPFKCHICNKWFSTKVIRNIHKKSHLARRVGARAHKRASKHQCDSCAAKFASREQLSEHRVEAHRSAMTVKCEGCGRHFEESEQPPASCADVPPPHGCAQCGRHFKIPSPQARPRTNAKPLYKCVVCKTAFDNADQLAQHLNTHLANYKRL